MRSPTILLRRGGTRPHRYPAPGRIIFCLRQSAWRCSLMDGLFAIRRSSILGLARTSTIPILVGIAGLAFVVGPSVIHGRIPGDIGDARLTSYILEHFFRWITGQDASFWGA